MLGINNRVELAAADRRFRERKVRDMMLAGVTIVELTTPELSEIPDINAKGGFTAYEAYAFHKTWMNERPGDYDPRVLVRILKGELQSDEDYRILQTARRSLIERMAKRTADADAMVMPTVPIIAPTIAQVAERRLRVRWRSKLGAPTSWVHRPILSSSSSNERSKLPQQSSKSRLITTVDWVIYCPVPIA